VDEDEIQMNIQVQNKDTQEVLFDETVTASGETLADFLEDAKELDVEMEDGEYGKKIISILDLKTEDWNKGPWWVYESEDNKTCKEAGMCPAASDVVVEDGDHFTFTFTSTF
ncbi:MAG: hypothetical protein Q4A76_06980, partial [Porphyromonadaceae bacterium]|nr:hypothetical protein [Porphyromonadaceae bacterium]